MVFLKVCGWARAAPLSCILISQKSPKKTKHKDAEAPIPSSVHQTPSREVRSADMADLRNKRLIDLQKTVLIYPQINFGNHAGERTHPIDATKRLFLNAPQRNLNYFFVKKKLEEEQILREACFRPHQWPSKCFVFEKRLAKPRRHNQRPKNTAIPIKTFTFLPAIEPPHINHNVQCHGCRNLNVPEKHNFYEKMFDFDSKNETQLARRDTITKSEVYNVALISKDKTCQRDPSLFSAISGSFPKKYQVPVSQS